MKSRARLLLSLPAMLPAFAAPAVATPEVDPVALTRLVRQDCGACHGMRLTGGLGSPLTAAALKGKPLDALTASIRYGRPGTAMPAWQSLLSPAQIDWIATQLVAGFPEESR